MAIDTSFFQQTAFNNGITTLALPLSAEGLDIVVTDASVFQPYTTGQWFWLTLEDLAGNMEIVKVTNVTNATLRIERSNTPMSFAAGCIAENRPQADDYLKLKQHLWIALNRPAVTV